MKTLHPQKRRLNALQTIERIARKAAAAIGRKVETANAAGGTMHMDGSGQTEGDLCFSCF